MICELPVALNMSEIAAISQRSLAEQMVGEPAGVFTSLWLKVQQAIRTHEKAEKRQRKAA